MGNQDDEEQVDVHTAREYMKETANVVVEKLVRELAINQPADVLEYLGEFVKREIERREREKNPVCCVSGTPAEVKVKVPGTNDIEFYARDIFDALKRKNKLRGAVWVEIDQDFPEEDTKTDGWVPGELDPEFKARLEKEDIKTFDELASRPVTPPKRGFEMTRPGENYHNERAGPINVGPVKFEARALGSVSEGEEKDGRTAALDAAAKRLAEQHASDNLSEEQRKELQIKRKKDALVGKIKAHYATMGGTEPLGLAASSIETLQKHLSKLKNRIDAGRSERVEHARTEEKKEKLNNMVMGITKGTPGRCIKPQAPVAYEPRALGSSSTGGETNEEDPAAKRRERAALAAARRYKTVK
mmetsp:Transcript_10966/g.17967  ORF Transcript_10966/g.17967 Transcript_10966/m.17967 type:complete len:359 (+) Transcript_10966:137-1213(+)